MTQLITLERYHKTSELYLRALWGRGFIVNGVVVDEVNNIPLSYLADETICLPDKVSLKKTHEYYYRAAATHASLHVMSAAGIFTQADLNFMQRSVVGLVEDLRLELRAIQHFPGLRRLWLDFHQLAENKHVSAPQLLLRLSRSVLDPEYQDDHHWVCKGRQKILNAVAGNDNSAISMEVGLSLANDLGQMRLPLNSGRYEQSVAYRDDNRCLWQNVQEHSQQAEISAASTVLEAQQISLVEADTGFALELSDSTVQGGEGLRLEDHDDAVLEYRQTVPTVLLAERAYPEWDYRSQVLKQDWCRVQEYAGRSGSGAIIDEISARHKYTLSRLRRMAKRLRIEKQQWLRKLEDGEQLDLASTIDAMVAVRGRMTPDARVFMRKAQQQEKNLAISILLDLSESTNERIDASQQSITQILRDAVLLLGETLSAAGDDFSIAGFSSNGRHEVNVTRFKSFTEEFEASKSRLSEIRGCFSTRLGAAIRHSASELALQPQQKKLLLVITDGAPSDIDVYDQHYLLQDSWYAVRGLHRQGIKPFCINLHRRSDAIIEHIFGRGRAETIDSVVRLPDLLAHLYLRYMRA